MLDLLDTAAVALAELMEVLQVLIAEVVVLVLRVELQIGEGGREGGVVAGTMGRGRTCGWRRTGSIYGQKVVVGVDARRRCGGDLGGLELHGRRPLFATAGGHGCHADGLGLRRWGRLGDVELEGLEVAFLANGSRHRRGACRVGDADQQQREFSTTPLGNPVMAGHKLERKMRDAVRCGYV